MTGEPIDTVTVLTTFGPLAPKTVFWRSLPAPADASAGEWVITPYGNAKTFSIAVRNVSNIYELAGVLDEIEQDPRSLIVRGQPAEGVDLTPMTQLHPGTAATARGTGDGTSGQRSGTHTTSAVAQSAPQRTTLSWRCRDLADCWSTAVSVVIREADPDALKGEDG